MLKSRFTCTSKTCRTLRQIGKKSEPFTTIFKLHYQELQITALKHEKQNSIDFSRKQTFSNSSLRVIINKS